MSESLFGPLFVPNALREAVGGRAWVQAMLDAEAALAVAEARAGLIPASAAEAISECCSADLFDPEQLGRDARSSGNPVPPLVRALTDAVSESGDDETARYVHEGATSQDILDTAATLVSRRALGFVLADLDGISEACARLAAEHRSTVMAGRTLMQQALPTAFGLKAAGWLVSTLEARRGLLDVRGAGLAAELGGAAGTLASLGGDGLEVLRGFAEELGLPEPVVPWHAARLRIAGLGNALSLVAGVVQKIALDIILLSQTEVGEVAEATGGGSSTLPHKRNPVGSVLSSACARRVPALAGTLQEAMAAEHERAAGAWHTEWETLSDALAMTGGATAAIRGVLEGLQVDAGRMRENLGATGGLLLSENMTTKLAGHLGRLEAHDLVQEVAHRTLDTGASLREELLAEPRVGEHLSPEDIDAALDPQNYLGSAGAFIDRALELYEKEKP